MSFFRGILGPSREEVWRQLSQEIGADFVDGGFWRGDKVEARVKNWTITLDTYTVSTGKSNHTFTRMSASFRGRGDFRFKIYRKGFFSGLGKALGMMDIDTGHSVQFDEDFIVQASDESMVRALLAEAEVRRLIDAQPKIQLELKDDKARFFGRLPEGVDLLIFHVHGVVKDVERLKLLFDLFAAVLDRLAVLGLAGEEAPEVRE